MTNRAKLVLGLAVGIGISSPVLTADEVTVEMGMKACAEALMASLSQKAPTTNYVVQPQGRGMHADLRRTQMIYLDAALGEENVAKANCRVNKDAVVTNLELLPGDAPEARRRAL